MDSFRDSSPMIYVFDSYQCKMLIVDRMRKEINDECKTFDLFLDILEGFPMGITIAFCDSWQNLYDIIILGSSSCKP